MDTDASGALHQVQTGIKDVLAGYETLEDRAVPEILPVVRKLTLMHERHSAEIDRRLALSGERTDDEASIRGTVNQAVVAMRDWVSSLGTDALSFVRDGEERLAGIYDDALQDTDNFGDSESMGLLTTQRREVEEEARQLPAS